MKEKEIEDLLVINSALILMLTLISILIIDEIMIEGMIDGIVTDGIVTDGEMKVDSSVVQKC